MLKAKEYLLQIRKVDKLIENKLIEKEQWKSIATNTTSYSEGERVQSSGSQQKMADAVLKMIEIEEQINEYVDLLIGLKQRVIRTIEKLPPIEYDILHKVYIQGKELDEVADMYDKTYSWATTIHGRALKHIQKIIDNEGDDAVNGIRNQC